ncbi:MAG TPA: hypothetical protein VNU68_35545 [Verrucomicrobiae bacterium]|nr:hypothetical protein [Verrucomicrobiae bacterium]
MSSLFDKLNLRPQERRLVVIVGIVVFVALNFWLVIPMFGEYGRNGQRILDVKKRLKTYQDEISKKNTYEKELRQLETSGVYIPTEEAGLRMSQEISSQAALSGVTITSMTQMQRNVQTGGKTNAFFDEAAVTVNVNSGEKELVEFLWHLADKETLIRAKSMTVGPDPSRMRLQGQITLVKSFQKRPTKATATTASTAASTAANTTASNTAKPAAVTKTQPPPKTNAPGAPKVATPVAKPAAAPPQTPSTGSKPLPHAAAPAAPNVVPPPGQPGVPAPIPAPSPGGTNRFRRTLPTPAKPQP